MTIDLHKLFDIFDNKCHLMYWHNKSTAVIDLFYLQSDYVEILFSIIAYGDRISFRIIIYPCEMIKNTIKTNAIRNIYVYGLFVVQQLSLLRLSLSDSEKCFCTENPTPAIEHEAKPHQLFDVGQMVSCKQTTFVYRERTKPKSL